MALVYIGLGTNLGEREKNLKKAIDLLDEHNKISITVKSTILDTAPVDYTDQPRFLNQIVAIKTELLPLQLLHFIKECERTMGRKKVIPKGPRIIDLDILLYNNTIIHTDQLIIPHPEIKSRPFILQHLVELDPELRDPYTNKKYSEVLQ